MTFETRIHSVFIRRRWFDSDSFYVVLRRTDSDSGFKSVTERVRSTVHGVHLLPDWVDKFEICADSLEVSAYKRVFGVLLRSVMVNPAHRQDILSGLAEVFRAETNKMRRALHDIQQQFVGVPS